MSSVLIVDDEPNIRRMVGALLASEGYEVRDAADGQTGVARAAETSPDVVLLDLMMPGELDGLGTLERLRERVPDVPVIMMSGKAGLSDAVKATKLGAFNFLEKPLSPEGVLLALASALELRRVRREARSLREDLGLAGEMIGGSAAIPRDLVESEMFGHEKGSFTGASDRRIGRFELAHTGTLFLDEVGDLGAEAQAKLLRAIEAKEIERGGGGKPIRVDVRIVSATNRDLTRAVADGSFREDLLFRPNVIPIDVPPLRERPDDIPALVAHFSTLHRARTGRQPAWTP